MRLPPRGTTADKHPLTVQVSLDVPTTEEALQLAEAAVRAGVDWLEAGTPLLLGEGCHAVRALKERFPEHPVVADLKTMDGGYLEAEMMAKAGADLVVVMARAHPATVRAVVRAARDYDVRVMGDDLGCEDKAEAARMLEAEGVDYVIHHTGYDERHEDRSRHPLRDLEAVVKAVRLPVQAVGGLTLDQVKRLPEYGAPLVVIGAPLAIDDTRFAAASSTVALEAVLKEVVSAVKGR